MATAQNTNSKFVGKVRVFHLDHNNDRTFIGLYDEKRLVSISSAARDVLKDQKDIPKVMTVKEVDKDALKYVLTTAVNHGKNTRLHVNDRPMLDCIYVLDIVEVLGIIPPQPKVEGILVHKLTHSPISPQAMMAVHKFFGPQGKSSRPWRVMVHQLAWDVVHGNLSGQRLQELNTAAPPDLDKAVKDRVAYLRDCMEHKEQKQQYQQAKAEQRENMGDGRAKTHKKKASKSSNGGNANRSNEPGKDTRKMLEEHKQALQEKKEQMWLEEEHGLRPASEETVEYLKHQGPTSFWITPKLNQRQRKVLERVRQQGGPRPEAEDEGDDEGEAEPEDREDEDVEEGGEEGDGEA